MCTNAYNICNNAYLIFNNAYNICNNAYLIFNNAYTVCTNAIIKNANTIFLKKLANPDLFLFIFVLFNNNITEKL